MPRKRYVSPDGGEPEVVDVLAVDIEPVEAELEAAPPDEPVRPRPESELTAEQRRIRDLENQLAVERGRKDPELEYDTVADGERLVIHFLEDGFTALGQVWYRGQELEFTKGQGAYNDTCDRLGRSWVDLRDDEFAQVERWGKVVFRSGPWPGKSYVDAADVPFEVLKPLKGDSVTPGADELEKAQVTEAKRRRAAPRLPVR